MDIEFTGVIIAALPVQQGTSKRDGKPWAKQEFVIEELNQRYPSRICFQVFGSDKLQQFNIGYGEILTVHLSPSANQAQDGSGRWFNQVDCWKISRPGAQQAPPQGQVVQSQVGAQQPQGYQQQQQFPPQVNAAGQPYQQPTTYAGGAGQPSDGLPFPPQ